MILKMVMIGLDKLGPFYLQALCVKKVRINRNIKMNTQDNSPLIRWFNGNMSSNYSTLEICIEISTQDNPPR